MFSEIDYVIGSATSFKEGDSNDLNIIAHICNDIGVWGAGFTYALDCDWPEVGKKYRSLFANKSELAILGQIQVVAITSKLHICNMIAQHGISDYFNGENVIPPIRYDALTCCLRKLANRFLPDKVVIHMPRIGCGLAGGEWSRVEQIIKDSLCQNGFNVKVYTLHQEAEKFSTGKEKT